MSLPLKLKKIKYLFISLSIALIISISYALGFIGSEIAKNNRLFVVTQEECVPIASSVPEIEKEIKKDIVASKNGTKFYYTWCSGVGRIKEENKVYFDSILEAQNRGFTAAKGCPGLEAFLE